jgi:magnesium transporter
VHKHGIIIRARQTDGFDDCREISIDALERTIAVGDLVWIDVCHPESDQPNILGTRLNLGPLTVEDMLLPVRMPKLDPLPSGAFIAAFVFRVEKSDAPRLVASAISLVVGPRYLVTVRRSEMPEVLERLDAVLTGRFDLPEQTGAAMAYAALDALVDRHLPETLRAAELAEELEERLDPQRERESLGSLESMIVLRRDLLAFRRLGVAQQEVLRRLSRRFPHLREYLSDVADDQREAVDTAAATCDYIDGAIEAFRVGRDVRTGYRIRQLTVLAAIFAPLSFTIGLWGLNFSDIPGTNSDVGWYVFVVFQIAYIVATVVFFRLRGLI